MKKLAAILLSLLISAILVFAACKKNESPSAPEEKPTSTITNTPTITGTPHNMMITEILASLLINLTKQSKDHCQLLPI